MKKLLCILIAAVLIAVFPGTSAFAAEEPRIVVSSAEAESGDEIVLTVAIENNPGITNGFITITYDEAGLEFVELDTTTDFWRKNNGIAMNNGPAMSFIIPIETTDSGVLCSVTFRVKDRSPGNYQVGVDVDYIVNDANKEIAFQVVPGKVSVSAPSCDCTKLEDVAEVPAGTDTDGVKAHQKCKNCGRRYLDGVAVDLEDLKIPAAGTPDNTPDPTDPKPGENQGQTGSKPADPTEPQPDDTQDDPSTPPAEQEDPSDDQPDSSLALPVILAIVAVAAVVIVVVLLRRRRR